MVPKFEHDKTISLIDLTFSYFTTIEYWIRYSDPLCIVKLLEIPMVRLNRVDTLKTKR